MLENYILKKKILDKDNKLIGIYNYNNVDYIIKKAKTVDDETIRMLKNETNILHYLKSSMISPKLINFNFDNQDNYIIMEFINGTTLNNIKLNSLEEALTYFLKILDAVNILHKYNITHCDLKPTNIILTNNNEIKIIDYEISTTNKINQFTKYGSLKYCSIEQLHGKKLDNKTDIYSLGIIFYELLKGKSPFGNKKQEIINNKINNKYKRVDDILLDAIFNKSICADKCKRYNNISEFKKDIENYLLIYLS